ncbi:hypothetical protein [Propionivibrio sp.]|nr:hypothetical protein [Propionivibrio sp.]
MKVRPMLQVCVIARFRLRAGGPVSPDQQIDAYSAGLLGTRRPTS